jgi:hypothetical protein
MMRVGSKTVTYEIWDMDPPWEGSVPILVETCTDKEEAFERSLELQLMRGGNHAVFKVTKKLLWN